jgi:dihydroorotase/N-acyl-D-amino-acid deacylase
LPAATIGMVDRGLIRVGMAADITVFDPATVIDHSTYEEPALPSEGIRFVLVNGQIALADGHSTGVRAGRPLTRTSHMPSRPSGPATPGRVFSIKGSETQPSLTIDPVGSLQTAGSGWTSVTGLTGASSPGGARAVTVIVDEQNNSPGNVTVVVMLEGAPPWSGTMPAKGVSVIK